MKKFRIILAVIGLFIAAGGITLTIFFKEFRRYLSTIFSKRKKT